MIEASWEFGCVDLSRKLSSFRDIDKSDIPLYFSIGFDDNWLSCVSYRSDDYRYKFFSPAYWKKSETVRGTRGDPFPRRVLLLLSVRFTN